MFRSATFLVRNLKATGTVARATAGILVGVAANQSRFISHAEGIEQPAFKPTIYQYLICPFCNRVKSYLDYCGIEYNTVEVNPLTKSEIDFPVTSPQKKVPIAIINGNKVEDSAKIIEVITEMGNRGELPGFPGPEFFPSDTAEWNEWSEKKLAVMLYPNITRTLEESWECFEYAGKVPTWNAAQQLLVRVAGTAAMSLANGKIKKKYNIVDERKELKETVNVWCTALQGRKFLHGEKPTMPDIQVYGVLRSIQGLRTFNELMAENAVLKTWYHNVEKSMPAKADAKQ
jgi:microsomal prostaglandin-E synthase 2